MQTLILTNNARQAEFIQKGLRYESLSSDVFILVDDLQYLFLKIPFYDGVFLLFHGISSSETIALLKKIKDQKDIPVVALFQEGDESQSDIVSSNLLDGVFTRPFPFRNMSSDMKYEIFNRKESLEVKRYILRDLELDIERHLLLIGGKHVPLRNKEFALLHFMILNKGKVISRTTILENVWDRNSDIMTNTVDVHVSQLRKKIKALTTDIFFHTVPCMGYILE